jgi:hypothetical protein
MVRLALLNCKWDLYGTGHHYGAAGNPVLLQHTYTSTFQLVYNYTVPFGLNQNNKGILNVLDALNLLK